MFDRIATEPLAQPVFAEAASVLGTDPRDLVQSDAPERWQANFPAQVLCVTSALGSFACLNLAPVDIACVTGYSVGLVAAWSIAGRLSLPSAFQLIRARSRCMDGSVRAPQGMLAVSGIGRAELQALCEATDVTIAIANPSSFVIGGTQSGLEALSARLSVAGTPRVTRLPVHVASHTVLMRQASADFTRELADMTFTDPSPDAPELCDGLTGRWVRDTAQGRAVLSDQLSETIEWADCLQACLERGADSFLELGPGSAMAHMAANLRPGIRARSIDQFESITGLRGWLAREMGGCHGPG